MARKATDAESSHSLNDIFGVIFLAGALLLLVAQLSFDRYDLSINRDPPNHPAHNWIGPLGARLAYASFFICGFAGFMLPVVLAFLAFSCWFKPLAYLKRRWPWAVVLLVSCMGWLHLVALSHVKDPTSLFAKARIGISAPSTGGFIGMILYDYLFWMLGVIGAGIVYGALDLISLLFLTNFQLGEWVRGVWAGRRVAADGAPAPAAEEQALEKRARELKKQAKQLEEEVQKRGLGPDLRPVPEPTVPDLSISQTQASARKPVQGEPPKEPAPPDEGEVIPAREVTAATTADILGKKRDGDIKSIDSKADNKEANGAESENGEGKPGEPKPEPEINITGLTPARPKPKKPKPITVASTPRIGNYELPPTDFLNYPDPGLRPTESKEELMANARLMQQTLAQFDIEVSLGDITKGPTITRYELHPAPGVKLEKITALNNNIAAALKAERIHILAPVPGKSSVGVEVPNLVKTKVIMRDLLESDEWRSTKARIPLALGKDVYGNPRVEDLAEMPHLLIAGTTGAGKSVCINAIITSLLYRFPPDELRFVMIDPKVVELQHYNALPHLVVPVITDPKKVILALRWVVNEMEKRYQIFARVGVRNIKSFNERPKNTT